MARAGKNENCKLDIAGYDQAELVAVLMEHFGTMIVENEKIIFGNLVAPGMVLEAKKSLKILYAKAEEIPKIKAKIAEAIEAPQTEQVSQAILLSKQSPVDCFYRFADEFQIIPVPCDAPKEQNAYGLKHACLLQFKYKMSPVFAVDDARRKSIAMKIVAALSVLTGGSFEVAWHGNSFNLNSREWFFRHTTRAIKIFQRWFPSRSILGWKGYHYHGYRLVVPSFDDPTKLKPVKMVAEQEYYAQRGNPEFFLPDSIDRDLAAIFALSEKKLAKFRTAAQWAQKSEAAWTTSQSLSYVAAVNAIEGLLPKPSAQKLQQCHHAKNCQNMIPSGPSALFREFMQQHLGDGEEAGKLIRQLYSIRSGLSHGNYVLDSDMEGPLACSATIIAQNHALWVLRRSLHLMIRSWALSAPAEDQAEAA